MALYAFDGTWNQPDTNDGDHRNTNTNVFRFAQAYAEAHGDTTGDLVPHYEKGIGTKLGKAGRVIGGFTGAGGRERVEEMLEFCAAEFAAGDTTVDIIGFSRGAALALHFANKLTEGVKVKRGHLRAESIRFLGLWDTVPAFGVPGAIIDWAKDINIGWELDLPPRVAHCAHALARHERRQAFDVHRLDPTHRHAHVRELWFRGVHSDIGGGNGNIALNDNALRWMMEEGHAAGIPFTAAQIATATAEASPDAAIMEKPDKFEKIDRPFYEGDVFHPSAVRRLAVGESKMVPVDSRLVFDFSGLFVEPGDCYTFAPDPTAKWYDADIECTAAGWPEDLDRTGHWWKKITESVLESRMVGTLRRVREAAWFEMCAGVGFDDRHVIAVGRQQHATQPWRCERAGPLSFFANDALHPFNKYGNNQGSINVNVTRVA